LPGLAHFDIDYPVPEYDMPATRTMTAIAASLAFASLLASDLGASAQTRLSSTNPYGINGRTPSRAMVRRPATRVVATRRRPLSYGDSRPLTVRRPLSPQVVEAAPVVNTGPGTIVTGPLGFGSEIVSLPFRGLNSIFPATGDIGTNPLVLIGAPLRAIGEIVQVPFRIVGAPFGGTTIATY